MSDLTKKRMRYEILEDVETFLQNRIKSCEEEIEWRSQPDDDGNIPEWRQEEIGKNRDKISEIQEVIKALPKLG